MFSLVSMVCHLCKIFLWLLKMRSIDGLAVSCELSPQLLNSLKCAHTV